MRNLLMKKRRINAVCGLLVLLVTAAWMLVACQLDEQISKDTTDSDETTTSTTTETGTAETTLSMSQSTLGMLTGATAQLSTVVNNAATGSELTWTSSNPAVATVDQTGLVSALTAGTAYITATLGTLTATCTVTVTNSEVTATSVSVSPTSASLTSAGQTRQLTAAVLPSNATNVTYTWKSSNTSVATVSQSGVVTAVANGTTTITLTTNGGLTATATITVAIATTTTTTTTYAVNTSYCTGCGHCRSACPNGAITMSSGKAYINPSKCTACGRCYSACGRGAIQKTTTTN
jgi:uncharacterized protein YjdB